VGDDGRPGDTRRDDGIRGGRFAVLRNPRAGIHGTAFFVAFVNGAQQLVASDGTAGGTFIVPAPSGFTGWHVTESVAKLGSTIVFSATTNETGEELWAYGPIDLFADGFE
jgi:hypothetical protein